MHRSIRQDCRSEGCSPCSATTFPDRLLCRLDNVEPMMQAIPNKLANKETTPKRRREGKPDHVGAGVDRPIGMFPRSGR